MPMAPYGACRVLRTAYTSTSVGCATMAPSQRAKLVHLLGVGPCPYKLYFEPSTTKDVLSEFQRKND